MKTIRLWIVCFSAALLAISCSKVQEKPVAEGFLKVQGQNIVKPDGEKFFIRGINLGNWINPEGYMFRFGETSSYRLINQMFCELTGEEFTANFWNQFKENYITEADIHYIAQTGMNTLHGLREQGHHITIATHIIMIGHLTETRLASGDERLHTERAVTTGRRTMHYQ